MYTYALILMLELTRFVFDFVSMFMTVCVCEFFQHSQSFFKDSKPKPAKAAVEGRAARLSGRLRDERVGGL